MGRSYKGKAIAPKGRSYKSRAPARSYNGWNLDQKLILPTDLDAMATITGVAAGKLYRYGAAVLQQLAHMQAA